MIPRVFFVGTAGAGKSTMVNAFLEWLEGLNYDSITLNLDPGAEYLPYTPDVDIRENISLESVMSEYNLGPNGAQVVAADLMVQEIERIRELIDSYDTDYVLVDVPGQLELFAFREASRYIIEQLDSNSSSIVYLFDSGLMKNPSSYISSHFLALSVLTRFYVPFFPVISKSDLLSPEEKERVSKWDKNIGDLLEDLKNEKPTIDVQFSESLINSINSFQLIGEKIMTSSKDSEGMEDIYSFLQNVYQGGEDLEKR